MTPSPASTAEGTAQFPCWYVAYTIDSYQSTYLHTLTQTATSASSTVSVTAGTSSKRTQRTQSMSYEEVEISQLKPMRHQKRNLNVVDSDEDVEISDPRPVKRHFQVVDLTSSEEDVL